MKKISLIIIIFIFAEIAISCVIPAKNKSCSYYYTSLLLSKLKEEKEFQVKALHMSYYKIKVLNSEEKSIVINFLKTLDKGDFIASRKNNYKPEYRLYINFKDETYIIDVFNKEDISIFPYDGDYKQDDIKMSNKYKCYNLYYLCKNCFN